MDDEHLLDLEPCWRWDGVLARLSAEAGGGRGFTPSGLPAQVGTLRRMKALRRALVALSLAGTIAGVLRMRGKGGVPPQEGGWREVSVPPR